MPTTTSQKKNTAASRRNSEYDVHGRYAGYGQTRSAAARAYDYTKVYPGRRVQNPEPVRPKPKVHTGQVKKHSEIKTVGSIKQKQRAFTFKVFLRAACVFVMCCLMVYRYSVILESNDKITKLTDEFAKMEASKQAIQTKIDKSLELGTLENYAKTQLGMIYPDNSQIFYIDMQLGDTIQIDPNEEQKKSELALKGTPGALVHAIQVLK